MITFLDILRDELIPEGITDNAQHFKDALFSQSTNFPRLSEAHDLPRAAKEFQYFVRNLSNIEASTEEFIAYFYYRNTARLSIDYESVLQLAWELLFKSLQKCTFIRKELAAVTTTHKYIEFLKKYLNLFSNAIYSRWDRWLCSFAKKDTHFSKGRREKLSFYEFNYEVFNDHFIDSQLADSFVLKPDSASNEFFTTVAPIISSKFPAPSDAAFVNGCLSLAIDITPFCPRERSAQAMQKAVESHAALTLACYQVKLRNDTNTQFQKHKFAVKADAIRARAEPKENVLSSVIEPAIDFSSAPNLSEAILQRDELSLDDFSRCANNKTFLAPIPLIPGETALLLTALDRQNKILKEKQAALSSGFIGFIKRHFSFSYQILQDKINFLDDLKRYLEHETLDLYKLYQLTEKHPRAVYRLSPGVSNTEKILTLANDNLIKNNPEISKLIALFIQYRLLKKQDISRLSIFLKNNKQKIQLPHLMLFYKNSAENVKQQIKEFYFDYLRSFLHENKLSILAQVYKVHNRALTNKIIKHFEQLVFVDNKVDLDPEKELDSLIWPYKNSVGSYEKTFENGFRLAENKLQSYLAKLNTGSNMGKDIFFVQPENGAEPYLLYPHKKLGAGTSGRVWAAQKIFIKEAQGKWVLNTDKFPQEAAIKVPSDEHQEPYVFYEETCRLRTLKQEAEFSHSIVMPRIQGESLDNYVPLYCKPPAQGKSNDEIWKIVYQCLQQIRTFFQLGFLPCDIKPDNIMQTPDNNYQLIDFGSVFGSLFASASPMAFSPLTTPLWVREQLRSHVKRYENNPNNCLPFKVTYNLALVLCILGKTVMIMKENWIIRHRDAPPPLKESSTPFERYSHLLQNLDRLDVIDSLPSGSSAGDQELLDFTKILMSDNSLTQPKDFSLQDLDSFISRCENKLGISPSPPPVSRVYVR